ncbi:MAG: flagellar hook-basal body complex protein FliE [Phycisphaeraceae bacterium]|nr:MAG: flagellar hook-basal body complex protein FliE [Phycisphaeraceae bacterium]
MSDPLGFVTGASGGGLNPVQPSGAASKPGAPGFREVLLKNLEQVNSAQQDANRAVEDLMTGKRSDVEGVILATEKADDAFRMLQAMRGKVLQAYDEIKQVRV